MIQYTIDAEPSETVFHLIIYGELFAPDLDAILNQDTQKRRLSMETRLEFIKYCVPDFACHLNGRAGSSDPRRAVKSTGPYAQWNFDGRYEVPPKDNNRALTWVIRSSRWKPHWQAIRAKAGPDFQADFVDEWWYDENDDQDWRQRMWENVMICQGLEGLKMIREGVQDRWIPKIREWRDKIDRMEQEPPTVKIGKQATLESPYLLGDLRSCASGFVSGT